MKFTYFLIHLTTTRIYMLYCSLHVHCIYKECWEDKYVSLVKTFMIISIRSSWESSRLRWLWWRPIFFSNTIIFIVWLKVRIKSLFAWGGRGSGPRPLVPAAVTWCWSWWGSSSTWSSRTHWAPARSGQGQGSASTRRHIDACIIWVWQITNTIQSMICMNELLIC